ncbi:ribosomal protein S18-alanine N-acetyltransferase [Alteromonas gilva]|uniref:[Ribosomal protein bS18]-alanine N-acetyltransferase n=1 Tax=Alteromonas gilva TaxID=2987522 RepID=A0ABT5L756_9ALTE|nr:ribosomal protein S18-alanine N-acetyltransferase [Alteromonas gilva]MDC8831652.1 ribosomal protein S18-alanine N-acetyltransferase [Alteromonas gilva]
MSTKVASTPLKFELASPESLAVCYPIHCAVQVVPWSKSTFTDCTTSPYECWLVISDDVILGYAILLIVLDEVTVMDIAIAPEYQGQGVGKQLLQHVLCHCRHQQHRVCFLEVRESNQAAIHVYTKAGFALLERRKNYYPIAGGREDALMMSLQL